MAIAYRLKTGGIFKLTGKYFRADGPGSSRHPGGIAQIAAAVKPKDRLPANCATAACLRSRDLLRIPLACHLVTKPRRRKPVLRACCRSVFLVHNRRPPRR